MAIITDITALCAVIDAGNDTALPILADALEEAGDPRAEGLCTAIRAGLSPVESYRMCAGRWGNRHGWHNGGTTTSSRNSLVLSLYRRLRGGMRFRDISRHYKTRSAAYLALAAALSGKREAP